MRCFIAVDLSEEVRSTLDSTQERLRARAPKLKWFHQRPAGASNLLIGDLWGSDVTVTTSRGSGNTLAMAEYAVAGILYFAKDLPRAAADRETGG